MNHYSTRRSFLSVAAAALGAGGCGSSPEKPKQAEQRPPRLVLRAGWQTADTGDIAATIGLLRLVESNVPRAELTLWSDALGGPAREFITDRHPAVKIVPRAGVPAADFLLHGSGPVARADIETWRQRSSAPYGLLGVTVERKDLPEFRAVLDGAAFVFTRERASLNNLRDAGLPPAKTGYAPDSAFGMNLSNEPDAKEFLAANGLEPKKFIAVVPREGTESALRHVVSAWVHETGNKVLLCPEKDTDLPTLERFRASLPAQAPRHVVRRTAFWLPDEASSVYRRAVAVVSGHYYSPIIAAVNDTPSLYLHRAGDGIQGQIWDDLGLKRWYFEAENATGAAVWAALKSIRDHYAGVQVDVHEAVIGARRLQNAPLDRLRSALSNRLPAAPSS